MESPTCVSFGLVQLARGKTLPVLWLQRSLGTQVFSFVFSVYSSGVFREEMLLRTVVKQSPGVTS